jgi:hypothetical protein
MTTVVTVLRSLTDGQTAVILVEGNKVESCTGRHGAGWLPGGDRQRKMRGVDYIGGDQVL